jgi:dienelactone hydrolase
MTTQPPTPTTRLAARLKRRRQAIAERPKLYAAISLIVILFGFAIATPFLKAHLQAVAVLDLVANKPVPWVIRKIVAEPVVSTELQIPTNAAPLRARLYIPKNHPNAPALVVLHGVHHLGMEEPRLIAFATAMASCGLRVLTPELPDIADYHVGSNSIASIGYAAQYMTYANRQRPVGIMGLSFSGGLALLAASDPQFHPDIKFVVAIGSQDEMSRVATYYRTGEDPRPTGDTELLPPHEYGALVLEYQNLQDFVPAADVPALQAVLRAHLYEDGAGEHAAIAALNPQQLAESKQLLDTSSPATRAALQHSEALHIEAMAGVSPHGHLQSLTTPVYLLHGAGDNIIPAAETEWMAAELPSESLQSELISPVLSHINLDGANPTAADQWRLVHFFALILHAAEAN